MEKYILDFERPLTDLENKIQEMRDYSLNQDVDLSEEISKLEEEVDPERKQRRRKTRSLRQQRITNTLFSRPKRAKHFYEQGIEQLEKEQYLAASASLKLAVTYNVEEPEYARAYQEALEKMRTEHIDLAGKIIEAANAAGANNVEVSGFELSDNRGPRAEVIALATRNAIAHGEASEEQSSSGLIVSTGTGATGWARSIMESRGLSIEIGPGDPALAFLVREPWPSPATGTSLAVGKIEGQGTFSVLSHMQSGGVVFADGIEQDHLKLDWGTRVEVAVADTRLNLVTG